MPNLIFGVMADRDRVGRIGVIVEADTPLQAETAAHLAQFWLTKTVVVALGEKGTEDSAERVARFNAEVASKKPAGNYKHTIAKRMPDGIKPLVMSRHNKYSMFREQWF